MTTAIKAGDRVEGGYGADRDAGRVLAVDEDGLATVAWDTGVRTDMQCADLWIEGERPAPHHYTVAELCALDPVTLLGSVANEGDTVDYVDNGEGDGGYLDGVGGDREWDDIRDALRARGLDLVDVGGHFTVEIFA